MRLVRFDLEDGELLSIAKLVRDEVLLAGGLSIVGGFPVEDLDLRKIESLFWRFGLLLGRPVSQSVMGDRLGHVTNVTDTDPHARAYRNANELTPHTDPADMLAFLCVRPARNGGISRFVSATAVHDDIERDRPDLLNVLYRGFRYHRFGEQGPGQPAITPHRVPVFSECDGVISCRYVRQYIEIAADEDPDIELSDLEREALDLFETTANRADLSVEFTLAPGEAVVANNFTVLHARNAFDDYTDPECRRLLLRLWLAAHPPRPLVPEVAIYDDEPGIAAQSGRTPSYESGVPTN